ncbi:hypothetical protein [Oceanirhabdus sp. W0125-5]|uniref:hypothetical protein n=1 Tax=Oceanirhabdus sp. W0125-5 TaxID=2999116 RepID=UPI0022F2BCDE|nr:hypothetical protein [Oceanirhabdus sp. W0125-5]WBW97454.1 hypothetical protein OW730_00945 [Oceanirhabdus sp. W0125-5]
MKQMRVGTFSLGILLVIIGVLILFGGIKGIGGALLILKFWPIILISIGIEVLYFVYRNKGEEVKLKYDVLAVFIFITLVLISSGVFIFNEFMDNEVSNVVMGEIKSKAYSDIMIKEYEFNKKDINRIVIEDRGNLSIKESTDDKIRIKTSVVVKASSKEVANEYKEKVIDIKVKDEHLLISNFNQDNINKLVQIGEIHTSYEMFVPADIEIDIKNINGNVDISGIKNNLNVYLKGAVLKGNNIVGDINIREESGYLYSFVNLDNIIGNIELDTYGRNVTLNNINGNLSGKVHSDSMQIEGLKGKCELSLKDCNFKIKYSDIIEEDINIDEEGSSIEIYMPKKQQGNFYLESNYNIDLESKKIFKEDDIKAVEDNKVIQKKIGEGPEINISVRNGNIRIK